MDAASIIRIEKGVDRSASALFGLACGYAAYAWFAGRAQEPVYGLEAAAAFVLGYVLSIRGLSSIQPEPRKVPVKIFDVREVEPMAPVERPAPEPVRPSAERAVFEEAQAVAETPVTIAKPMAERPIVPDQPVAETAVPSEVEPVADGPITQPVEASIGAPAVPADPVEEFGAADSLELELDDAAEAEVEGPQESSDSEIGVDEGARGARVVHLFDPASMPTPEEMISRIDHHLEGQPSAAQSADAAQALHQALAELRRSIR